MDIESNGDFPISRALEQTLRVGNHYGQHRWRGVVDAVAALEQEVAALRAQIESGKP
jgi:hypothetical protein